MVSLIIQRNLLTGEFVCRPNRFTAIVSIKGMEVPCYLPNPGRMLELLTPSAQVVLKDVDRDDRKTHYDLIAVYFGKTLVSIDSPCSQ